MKRRHLYIAGLLILCVLGTALLLRSRNAGVNDGPSVGRAPSTEAFSHPGCNVLVVGFDALRPDHTSVYGYGRDTTPHLARFAQQAYVFKRAYGVAPWTLPSFMSVFTAMYPTVSGVTNKWKVVGAGKPVETRLSPALVTLPQVLKRNGYALGGFTGDAGVSAKYGYGYDFDHYLDDVHFGGLDHSIPDCLKWLEQNQGKPWFVFLQGYDCHGQYDPPAGYTKRYVTNYHGRLKGGKDEQGIFREASLRVALQPGSIGEPRVVGMTPEDTSFYLDLYDEKVHDADERFGKFLERFKEMGLLDRTIIILISDHGEEFLDHGGIDHGHSLYDELSHVMMMVRFPHQARQHVVDDKVMLIDALPTALECLGIPIGHPTNGISLVPILQGRAIERNLYAETDYRLFVHKRSVRNERYKYVYNLVTRKRELYDLIADPRERENLVARNPRIASDMHQDLIRWLRSMNTPIESYEGLREDFIKEF